jgi:hypothetical protein
LEKYSESASSVAERDALRKMAVKIPTWTTLLRTAALRVPSMSQNHAFFP